MQPDFEGFEPPLGFKPRAPDQPGCTFILWVNKLLIPAAGSSWEASESRLQSLSIRPPADLGAGDPETGPALGELTPSTQVMCEAACFRFSSPWGGGPLHADCHPPSLWAGQRPPKLTHGSKLLKARPAVPHP